MASACLTERFRTEVPIGMTKDDFQVVLQAAFKTSYDPECDVNYQKVRVLTCSWFCGMQGDNLRISNYARRVAAAFQMYYNYECYHLLLHEGRNPQEALRKKLEQVFKDLNEETLVIFYYIGLSHKEAGRLHSLHFVPNISLGNFEMPYEQRHVDFNQIQVNIINTAKPRVLLLLDTPCVGQEVSLGVGREMVAAAADGPAFHLGSFSAALIGELIEAASRKVIITASQICARITNKLLVTNGDTGERQISTVPLCTRNRQRHGRPIHLAPIFDTTNNYVPRPWRHQDVLSALSVISEPAEVLLDVILKRTGPSEVRALNEWLIEVHPKKAEIVRQGFLGRSASLSFKVPLDVWANFPPSTPVRFMSFQSSAKRQPQITDERMDAHVQQFIREGGMEALPLGAVLHLDAELLRCFLEYGYEKVLERDLQLRLRGHCSSSSDDLAPTSAHQ